MTEPAAPAQQTASGQSTDALGPAVSGGHPTFSSSASAQTDASGQPLGSAVSGGDPTSSTTPADKQDVTDGAPAVFGPGTEGVDKDSMAAWILVHPKGRAPKKASTALQGGLSVTEDTQPRTVFKGKNKFHILEEDPGFAEMVQRAQAGLERPPADGTNEQIKRMHINNLPAAVRNTETRSHYPDFLPKDKRKEYPMTEVFQYRGLDTASYKTEKGSKGKPLREEAFAMISLEDIVFDYDDNLIGWPQVWADDANAHKKCIKVLYRLETQYPSLSIRIVRPGSDAVTMEIFGNSLARSDNGDQIGLKFTGGPIGEIDQDTLPANEHIKKLYDSRRLWRTQVQFYDQKPAFGARGEPVWHGISAEELERIRTAELTAETPYWERAVFALSHCRKFSILRGYSSDWEQTKPFAEFFTGCMYAVANYGNWWWYSLVSGTVISDRDFPFGTAVPRWMVKTVDVKYVGNKAVSYEPVQTTNFQPLRSGVYPDSDTVSFAYRLGLSREIEKQDHDLDRICKQSEGAVTAIIKPFHVEGEYIVSLRFNNLNATDHETILPELKRKSRLSVRYGGKDVRLSGFVVEDPFDLNRHTSVLANVETKNAPEFIDDGFEHNITVEFRRDVTSVSRAMNSVVSLHSGQIRSHGAYIPEICFGTPVPAKNVVDWTSDLYKHGLARKFYEVILEAYDLNDSQKQAAMNIIESAEGFNLIWGPPGTGKTTALAVIVLALTSLGHRIVFTASTNSAVRNAARAFSGLVGADSVFGDHTLIASSEYCRFTGAHYATDWAGALGKEVVDNDPDAVILTPDDMDVDDGGDGGDEEEPDMLGLGGPKTLEKTLKQVKLTEEKVDVEMEEDTWADDMQADADRRQREMNARLYVQIASETSERAEDTEPWNFPKRKLQFLQQWVGKTSTPGEELSNTERERRKYASEFTSLIRTLRQGPANKKPKARKEFKENVVRFEFVDNFWTAQYLQQVKVIFVTNSTSCHEALLDHFRPTFLLSDEAGQSTPPDAMTPMAAFKGTLREIVLAGDHQQLRPVVLSREMNEVLPWVERSLFQTAISDQFRKRKVAMFDTQYRMSPDVSEFVRKNFYGENELKDSWTVEETNETRMKFRSLMVNAKPAWNDRLRVAFHVEWEQSVYKGTTSFCNWGEAMFCVELAVAHIQAGIKADDVLIVTPYTGQQRLIKRFILAKSKDQRIHRVKVATTNEVQGREAKSVIVSFVRNNPENAMELGFIYERSLLCVELSRAKDTLCLVGNFLGWCNELATKKRESFLNWEKAELFKKLIEDVLEKRDIMYDEDFRRGMLQAGPVNSTFYRDVKPFAPAPSSSRGGRGGRGNAGGSAPVRGGIFNRPQAQEGESSNKFRRVEGGAAQQQTPETTLTHSAGRGGRGGRGHGNRGRGGRGGGNR